jgi:hypothetical protein
VIYGKYYYDYNDNKLLAHYGGKNRISVERLRSEYNRLKNLPVSEVTKQSPLKIESFKGTGTPQEYYDLNRSYYNFTPDVNQVNIVIRALDSEGRWLVKHAGISNPYIGDGQKKDPTDEFATTNTGDETDTSPYRDPSDQEYISTSD